MGLDFYSETIVAPSLDNAVFQLREKGFGLPPYKYSIAITGHENISTRIDRINKIYNKARSICIEKEPQRNSYDYIAEPGEETKRFSVKFKEKQASVKLNSKKYNIVSITNYGSVCGEKSIVCSLDLLTEAKLKLYELIFENKQFDKLEKSFSIVKGEKELLAIVSDVENSKKKLKRNEFLLTYSWFAFFFWDRRDNDE